MPPSSSHPIVFQNGRVLGPIYRVISVLSAPIAICMFITGVGACLPLASFGWASAFSALCWLLNAVGFAYMTQALWVHAGHIGFTRVLLDGECVEFRFGTRAKPEIVRMPWDQISHVQHERQARVDHYTILARDGASATFSSDTLFHTKEMATQIAANAHLSVEEINPAS